MRIRVTCSRCHASLVAWEDETEGKIACSRCGLMLTIPVMTEERWLNAGDPELLLNCLCEGGFDRSLRLFAAICCRRVWHLLDDERSRTAVEVCERAAEGLVSNEELDAAQDAAQAAYRGWVDATPAKEAAFYATSYSPLVAALAVAACVSQSVGRLNNVDETGRTGIEIMQDRRHIETRERQAQADLLRHLVGNPFRPCSTMMPIPTTVVQLAQSLYDGEDCAFALHDALLDAGLTEFAEHFQQAAWHPKGCWVLDRLLSKDR